MLGIDIAEKYVGLEENNDKAEIMALLRSEAKNGDIAIDPSETSWCAAWINFCERSVGNPGSGRLTAQSYNAYGIEVPHSKLERGDILVFHFPFDNEWQGHVTYFDEVDHEGNYICLGGNQSNSVRYSTYNPEYLIHARRYVK